MMYTVKTLEDEVEDEVDFLRLREFTYLLTYLRLRIK